MWVSVGARFWEVLHFGTVKSLPSVSLRDPVKSPEPFFIGVEGDVNQGGVSRQLGVDLCRPSVVDCPLVCCCCFSSHMVPLNLSILLLRSPVCPSTSIFLGSGLCQCVFSSGSTGKSRARPPLLGLSAVPSVLGVVLPSVCPRLQFRRKTGRGLGKKRKKEKEKISTPRTM